MSFVAYSFYWSSIMPIIHMYYHTKSYKDEFTRIAFFFTLFVLFLVPTFVGFLKDIESPYEVKDYVKCYLGESKDSSDFARQFLERRLLIYLFI